MHAAVAPTAPEQWTLYQQAVVDIQLADHALRVTPGPRGTAKGLFPESSGRTIHVITAFNPRGRTAPAEDNDRAQRLLLDEIDRRTLTWWPAAGGDAHGVHVERSAAVVGLSDAAARELGRCFGQDAIFAWTPDSWRLLSCAGDDVAVYGWRTTTTTRPADHAEVRSQWSNNTHPGSYGDMLSTGTGCVTVEAWVRTPQGSGPHARTSCMR
ncbi:DUF3293 domain-containing protein [Actinacidiphila oryziradicis]|uniref:DUF3293 domain-containing protein n=1 Tax=Actinacidiphila oryziradicis TaxID=2571141 RepID=UPI0023EFF7CF|nr:DUF3293 domain-containing protein [Actinacidiphila oryziradicis]MCW2870168.1 hypothetical protein [Actinacidiphila oryziradicis]